MGISERLWDDSVFGKPGTETRFTFVLPLLDHLGLLDASDAEKIAGLREWLVDHELYPTLEWSIRDIGLEAALTADAAAS